MAIEAASSTTNTDVNGIANEVKKELDKDAFFKLLITQLQNQDPLKPMEDKEFIAQMAQFSSLEQMSNMNQNLKQMIDVQRVNQNSSLIGKTVEKESVEEDETNLIKGEVEKISFKDGKTFAHLNNENKDIINVDNITAIY